MLPQEALCLIVQLTREFSRQQSRIQHRCPLAAAILHETKLKDSRFFGCPSRGARKIPPDVMTRRSITCRPKTGVMCVPVAATSRLTVILRYGGFKNHPIFDPNIYPKLTLTKQEYKNLAAPTINHFYEKLLKLKSLMNTKEGLRIAEERHQFMLDFLQQFYSEVGFNPIGTPFDLLQFGK